MDSDHAETENEQAWNLTSLPAESNALVKIEPDDLSSNGINGGQQTAEVKISDVTLAPQLSYPSIINDEAKQNKSEDSLTVMKKETVLDSAGCMVESDQAKVEGPLSENQGSSFTMLLSGSDTNVGTQIDPNNCNNLKESAGNDIVGTVNGHEQIKTTGQSNGTADSVEIKAKSNSKLLESDQSGLNPETKLLSAAIIISDDAVNTQPPGDAKGKAEPSQEESLVSQPDSRCQPKSAPGAITVSSEGEKSSVSLEENGSSSGNGHADGSSMCVAFKQTYRNPLLDSDSDSSSDSDTVEVVVNSDGENSVHSQECGPLAFEARTPGEVLPKELPPIEDLQISICEQTNLVLLGEVSGIVGTLVVIKSSASVMEHGPVNEDTVLFLDNRVPFGKVFEIFGPCSRPFYSVRFNAAEDIDSRGIKVGLQIFFAPRPAAPDVEITKYVFVNQLLRLKGSDASWADNNEPPACFMEYSDDEEEKRSQAKRRYDRNPQAEEGKPRNTNSKKKRNKPQRGKNFGEKKGDGSHTPAQAAASGQVTAALSPHGGAAASGGAGSPSGPPPNFSGGFPHGGPRGVLRHPSRNAPRPAMFNCPPPPINGPLPPPPPTFFQPPPPFPPPSGPPPFGPWGQAPSAWGSPGQQNPFGNPWHSFGGGGGGGGGFPFSPRPPAFGANPQFGAAPWGQAAGPRGQGSSPHMRPQRSPQPWSTSR